MRAPVLTAALSSLLLLAMANARPNEPPAADAATPATAKAEPKEEIVLPPGFKPKKRGKFVVYCRKETVMGTRFPAEKCYDESGIRAYLQEQVENREKVDQLRRICSTQGSCGSN